MTHEHKLQVKDALMRYISSFDTQAEAAASLHGISQATISQVKNENWELLSNKLWLQIARQVGFYCGEWHPADTSASLLLRILFADAQHYAMSYGITMSTGLGKTFTAKQYKREQENVIYIPCREAHNRRSFMNLVMETAGLSPADLIPDMINSFTTSVSAREQPLVIIDDAHKLKDRVLQLMVALANTLTGTVGVVIMGNEELRPRIMEGVLIQKTGYERLYNAFGKRFITLTGLSPRDVELVCKANSLFDEATVRDIAEACGGSLHGIPEIVQKKRNHTENTTPRDSVDINPPSPLERAGVRLNNNIAA
ncbi:AAA family ATPase [Flavipsychrobacter stenotrophus]|nr:AAA family ATPase [Flavipsychrobacter stenotrophus]